jgi:hypothetical protein
MQIKALLNSPMGKVFISILLGLGLATMFRTVCEEKNCIRFAGPVISDVDGKIFKHGEKCYKYEVESSGKCDETKRVLDIKVKPKEGDFGLGFGEF